MSNQLTPVLTAVALVAAPAAAQGFPFLFSTDQIERTLSGSAGTVLRDLHPNEVSMVEFSPCPVISAEKWSPRTCYLTMAGDENTDTFKWNPAVFGSIDALCEMMTPVGGQSNQRNVFWSPSAPMGNAVSVLPLRPGDTGRIVKNGFGDGQVQYFLRAEQVQQALGLPITPVVVDVDAIAADPNYGVFLSLDQDTVVNTTCGVVFVRDGDVLLIPAPAITWTFDLRVAAVVPGSVLVVHPEAQMDLFVATALVTDRNGVCVNAIQDLEALDIDYSGPTTFSPGCTGIAYPVPSLIFTGELLTGGAVLTTAGGGQILNRGCGPIGQTCGGGPTLGLQMGLLPPTAAQGIPSYISALTTSFPHRFVLEPKQHVLTAPAAAMIDSFSPGVLTVVFARFESPLPATVAVSLPGLGFHFPDEYITGNFFWSLIGNGFSTYTTPVIPWPCKTVWQAVCITSANTIELSTPMMLDVQ
jgi:hypothetical protein